MLSMQSLNVTFLASKVNVQSLALFIAYQVIFTESKRFLYVPNTHYKVLRSHYQLVCYSRHGLNNGPFNKQIVLDHSNWFAIQIPTVFPFTHHRSRNLQQLLKLKCTKIQIFSPKPEIYSSILFVMHYCNFSLSLSNRKYKSSSKHGDTSQEQPSLFACFNILHMKS